MDVEPYLANTTGIDTSKLLDDWQWLLGDRACSVFRATAMGDLIVRDTDGRFHLLDMIDGRLQALADSEPELWTTLSDRDARKTFLFTFIVRNLRTAGVLLGPGECYSPEIPPVLGGTLDSNNLRPCSLATHASILGQLHRQVREMPHGTQVDEVRGKIDSVVAPSPWLVSRVQISNVISSAGQAGHRFLRIPCGGGRHLPNQTQRPVEARVKVYGVRLYPQTTRKVWGADGAPILIHGRISDDCADFIYIFRGLGPLYAGHTFVSSFGVMDGEDPMPGLREQFGSSLIDAELDGQLMLLRGDDFPSWSARYPDQCQYLLVFREVPPFDLARRLFWDTDFSLTSATWPEQLRAVIHCWDDVFWQLFSSNETDVNSVIRSHAGDPKLEMFLVDLDREYPDPSNEELLPASVGEGQ